jgi:hypothetical protein
MEQKSQSVRTIGKIVSFADAADDLAAEEYPYTTKQNQRNPNIVCFES